MHNCSTKGRPPTVVPARFLVACEHGHLDDFPWLDFVHRGKDKCPGPLRMYELGVSGEAADVEVKCDQCGAVRRMAEAFGRTNEVNMPACRGRHPHLRTFDPDGCDQERVTAILQGASNSWFSIMLSALHVPRSPDKLARLVEENWVVLEKAISADVVTAFRQIGQLKEFGDFTDAEVWDAVEAKRNTQPEDEAEATDLKRPEWEVFSNPTSVSPSRDFRLKGVLERV